MKKFDPTVKIQNDAKTADAIKAFLTEQIQKLLLLSKTFYDETEAARAFKATLKLETTEQLLAQTHTILLIIKNVSDICCDRNHVQLYAVVIEAIAICAVIYSQFPGYQHAIKDRNNKQHTFDFETLANDVLARVDDFDIALLSDTQQEVIFYALWEWYIGGVIGKTFPEAGYYQDNKIKYRLTETLQRGLIRRCLQMIKESQYPQFALNKACLIVMIDDLAAEARPIAASKLDETYRKLERIDDVREVVSIINLTAQVYENAIATINTRQLPVALSHKIVCGKLSFDKAMQYVEHYESLPLERLTQYVQSIYMTNIHQVGNTQFNFLVGSEPLNLCLFRSLRQLNEVLYGMLGVIKDVLIDHFTLSDKPAVHQQNSKLFRAARAIADNLLIFIGAEIEAKKTHLKYLEAKGLVKANKKSSRELQLDIDSLVKTRTQVQDSKNLLSPEAILKLQAFVNGSTTVDAGANRDKSVAVKSRGSAAALSVKVSLPTKQAERATATERADTGTANSATASLACSEKAPPQAEAGKVRKFKNSRLSSKAIAEKLDNAKASMSDGAFGVANNEFLQIIELCRDTAFNEYYFNAKLYVIENDFRAARAALMAPQHVDSAQLAQHVDSAQSYLNDVRQTSELLRAELAEYDPETCSYYEAIAEVQDRLDDIFTNYRLLNEVVVLTKVEMQLHVGDVQAANALLKTIPKLAGYFGYHWCLIKSSLMADSADDVVKHYTILLKCLEGDNPIEHLGLDIEKSDWPTQAEIALQLARAHYQLQHYADAIRYYDAYFAEHDIEPADIEQYQQALLQCKATQMQQVLADANENTLIKPFILDEKIGHICAELRKFASMDVLQLKIFGGFIRDAGQSTDIDMIFVVKDGANKKNVFAIPRFLDEAPKSDPSAHLLVSPFINDLYQIKWQGYAFDVHLVFESDLPTFFKSLDITMNALHVTLGENPVIEDSSGLGVRDLAQGIVRIINFDNIEQLNKKQMTNAVMLLRALRHAAKDNREINAIDSKLIRTYAERITEMPPAQLRVELEKLFSSSNALRAVKLLQSHNMLDALLPGKRTFDLTADIVEQLRVLGEKTCLRERVVYNDILIILLQPRFDELFKANLPIYNHVPDKMSEAIKQSFSQLQQHTPLANAVHDNFAIGDVLKFNLLYDLFYEDFLQRMAHWVFDQGLPDIFDPVTHEFIDTALPAVRQKTDLVDANIYTYECLSMADQRWLIERFHAHAASEHYKAILRYRDSCQSKLLTLFPMHASTASYPTGTALAATTSKPQDTAARTPVFMPSAQQSTQSRLM